MTTLGFQDSSKIREFYSPDIAAARKAGRALGLRPASTQKGNEKFLVMIDMQWDFSDKGRLPVPGTFDDVERLIQRIQRGVMHEEYTGFIVTFDCHPPHTIHSDSWWVDENGMMPDVALPVRMSLTDPVSQFPFTGNFVNGTQVKYRPRLKRKWTVETYAQQLKAKGQDIWVFADHCREGTDGVMLIPALAECLEWASAARDIQPVYMYKGMIAETDWFGPFRPCVDIPTHPQGGLQTQYLDLFRAAARVEITGEAEDFCVRAGMEQVLEYFGSDPDVLRRINFIENTTSPIFPDDPAKGSTPNADFKSKMRGLGVQTIRHDASF